MLAEADAEELRGARVFSEDGVPIGGIDELFFDRDTGAPEWLGVKRGLIGSKWALIPVANVTVQGGQVRAAYSMAQIDDAPQIAGREITDSEESALCAHYGLARSTAESGSGLPRGRSAGETGGKPRPTSEKAQRRGPSSAGKKRAAYHVTPDGEGWKTVRRERSGPLPPDVGRMRSFSGHGSRHKGKRPS
jgi:hypothetical protein